MLGLEAILRGWGEKAQEGQEICSAKQQDWQGKAQFGNACLVTVPLRWMRASRLRRLKTQLNEAREQHAAASEASEGYFGLARSS